ncbi:formimidoylglutamate deiminase [Aliikangiella sp. IMCC44632]
MELYAESILIGNQWMHNQTLYIGDCGTIQNIQPGRSENAVDAGGVVIPGMVNCHSHAFQRAFAGFSEYRANQQDSFWSWRDIMYRFVAKMTPQDAHLVATFLYLEMLKAGYTSLVEFHYLHHQPTGKFYPDPAEMSHQVIQAAKQAGIAITHCPVLYRYAGFGEQAPLQAQQRFVHQTDDYLDLVDTLHASYQSETNIKIGIAPHSLRAVSQQQLKEIIPHIKKLDAKAPVHIHIAEQTQEVDDCIKYYHQRPVEWLLENFNVDDSWCLIHATHLTATEIEAIVGAQAVVGICPTTEANLGDGIFPTQEFLSQDGRIAIGSDSHIAVNVAEELRTLEYAQRLTLQQRAVLTSADCNSVGQNLYTKAAVNGASTLNQNVGALAVGKRADLIVLDQDHPSLVGKKQSFILDAAIFACSQLPVKHVMVAGQWVIENTQHPQQQQITQNYLDVVKKLIA